MAVQPIRLFGDPILRRQAIEVDDFDKEVRQLVTDLTDTMLSARGAGLAAPQIGVGLRVFTWHVDDEVGHLVNPRLELSAETEIRVWDSTSEVRYLVLPRLPEGTAGLDAAALAALVTRDSMIGAGLPHAPA